MKISLRPTGGCTPMPVAKKPKPKKPSKKTPAHPKTWRDAIRLHLAKVPEVDAVYVSDYGTYVHVYSVVEDFGDMMYKRLLRQEALIEKAFPKIYFEFHTSVHRGKKPTGEERHTSELVFLRR
jgi:hypothetical protein